MRRSSRPWRSGRRRCVDGNHWASCSSCRSVGLFPFAFLWPYGFAKRWWPWLQRKALHLGQPIQHVFVRKQSCGHSACRPAWLPRPPLSRPSVPTAAYILLCNPPVQLFDERPFLEELLEYLYSVEVRHCPQQLITHPRRCQPARAGVLQEPESAVGVSFRKAVVRRQACLFAWVTPW